MQQISDHYETLVKDIDRLNRLLPPVLSETDLESAQALREHLPKWLATIAAYHASVGLELRDILTRTSEFIEHVRRDYLDLRADYVTLHGAVSRLVAAQQCGAPLPWNEVKALLS